MAIVKEVFCFLSSFLFKRACNFFSLEIFQPKWASACISSKASSDESSWYDIAALVSQSIATDSTICKGFVKIIYERYPICVLPSVSRFPKKYS